MSERRHPQGETLFAAMPIRALADERLSFLHWRALAVVASYDRMSGRRNDGGGGCWISLQRLASEARCHRTNFSTVIGELEAWRYVQRERDPEDRRKFTTYRVVYENTLPPDKLSPDSLPPDKQSAADTLPTDKQSQNSLPTDKQLADAGSPHPSMAGDSLPKNQKRGGIVCQQKSQAAEKERKSGLEYIEDIKEGKPKQLPLSARAQAAQEREEKVRCAYASLSADGTGIDDFLTAALDCTRYGSCKRTIAEVIASGLVRNPSHRRAARARASRVQRIGPH